MLVSKVFSVTHNASRYHLSQGISLLPKRQLLESSKLKEFGYDNFTFDENGQEFFKQVENSVGNGMIAHHEKFLLFQQCFQKTCTADR